MNGNILYIGSYSVGSTSYLRANCLKQLFNNCQFHLVDTSIPFHQTNRVYRSIGFRYKTGPLIKKINSYLINELKSSKKFDLIWVDKGVYITRKSTLYLRALTNLFVHFTPDPAFVYHQSYHFKASLKHYDFAITSKKYELSNYYELIPKEKVILVTQGFDKTLHKPYNSFSDKDGSVVLIGHFEKERGKTVECLINKGIKVKIAGVNWYNFVKAQCKNPNLIYLGKALNGLDYAKTISKSSIGLGMISKWVPDKHTTRTFEIPACGTALATEYTDETKNFFKQDEVIFYRCEQDLAKKIQFLLMNLKYLKCISKKGFDAVHANGFDYESIINRIITEIT